ncbi:MAG: ATPase, T2SS/T4P/T4SS family [Alistipes sp.]|nr:ATPase, T2SS/T4P/T4SS family [Alistipes sp.]
MLSTLHTNSAWGCVTRLVDMGIHPYLLSETLIACVAQCLVRTLCQYNDLFGHKINIFRLLKKRRNMSVLIV